MSNYINEAIEKIDNEVKRLGTSEAFILAKYIKSELLNDDDNAMAILEPNKDLCTFIDRLQEVAGEIKTDGTTSSEEMVAIILDKDIEQITCDMAQGVSKAISEFNITSSQGCVAMSSMLILPLLHCYLGITADVDMSSNVAQKKKTGFKALSLDD